jgi:predicted PurR-regulated permease PerM
MLVGAVFLAFVLRSAFVDAHRIVGWVVACSIVALLLDPLVDLVDRILPRWLSVIVVLLTVLAFVATVTISLAGDLTDSLDELKARAPEAASSLEDRYDWARDIGVADRVKDFIDDLDDRVRKDAVSQFAETAPSYFVTGILMLFLLAFGRRYFDGLANQFGEPRRGRNRSVGRTAALRGRRYLLAALGMAILYGVVAGLVCWSLDLPAARSLGIAVGFLAVVPLIGVLVGGIPALLLAFGLEGWQTGAVVLAVLLALQLIEALVIRPVVDARSVRVGPTVAIVVGLLGFELYGVGGAVYGLALAIILLAALDAVGKLRDEAISG